MIEHDFTKPRWGWHIEVWDYDKNKFTGHGYGLNVGHIVLLKMNSAKIGKYKISEVKYERDPTDQFWITAKFVGYKEDNGTQ